MQCDSLSVFLFQSDGFSLYLYLFISHCVLFFCHIGLVACNKRDDDDKTKLNEFCLFNTKSHQSAFTVVCDM